MKARFIQEIGTRAYLRVYWGEDCPNCLGGGNKGYHNAMIHLLDSDKVADWDLGGKVENYPDEKWPAKCDHCGAEVPGDAKRQIFHERLYNTPSGKPEPGDLFFVDWYEDDGKCWHHDDGCKGHHLYAILPNGKKWDIDGRANNCTMPTDRMHRCWVRHGEPPNITVGKDGHTCQAGAGSIACGDYHGFLRNGEFVPA